MKRSTFWRIYILIGFLGGIYSTLFFSVSSLAQEVSAETGKENVAVWNFDKTTGCLTISGTGGMYDKEEVAEYSDNNWKWGFIPPKYSKKVKSIIIEPGITSIDQGVFSEFKALEAIQIPDTVTIIEDYAFYGCKNLEKIRIPDSVTKLGQECFWRCSNLKEIVIGKNVKEIGERAFFGCKKLRKVVLSDENPYLKMQDKILYSRDGKILYFCPVNGKKKVSIRKGTKVVASTAFAYNTNLKIVRVPSSVKIIEGGAFYHCSNLEQFSFEKNSQCITMFDYSYYNDGYEEHFGVFQGCKKIKAMRLPNRLQYLGEYTFDQCKSLKKIYFGKSFKGFTGQDSTKVIEKKNRYKTYVVYEKTALEQYTVSKRNTRYRSEDGVLYNKKKTQLYMYPAQKRDAYIKLPQGLKIIVFGAFSQNKYLQRVEFPDSLKRIKRAAFYCCVNLRSITLPKSMKYVGCFSFAACKRLENVYLDGNGAVMDMWAFDSCKALSKVRIGRGIRKIKDCVFFNCKNLESIFIPSSVKKIGYNVFGEREQRTINKKGFPVVKIIKNNNFIIYGKKGSAAEKYAKRSKLKFIAL